MSKGNGKNGAAGRLADPVFRKRLAIRLALCLVVVGLGVVSMILGKGHTIVLDDMRPKDGSYEPLRRLSVSVGKGKAIELSTGVRELVTVTGQRHTLVVDWMDGSAPVVKPIAIGFGQEYVIVYLPKLKSGAEPWIEPFFPFANAKPPEDAPATPAANGESTAPKP